MKISESKFYSIIFAVLVLLQIYLPSFRINILLQFGVILIFIFTNKITVSKMFLKVMMAITAVLLIGFLSTLFHHYDKVNIIKDIFHFAKPILGLAIGYFYFKKINNFKIFVKTIIICASICASIHFIYLFVSGNIFSGSVEVIRIGNKDNFLELFGLFFLIFYKKFQNDNLFESKKLATFLKFLILSSCLLYFSRTMIIGAVILILSINGFTIITAKTLKILGGVLVCISLFYFYLFSINIQRDKPGIENFLYKIKIAPSEIFNSKIDRENHADLWDHWRAYEAKRAFELMDANPVNYIIGCGHGSLVNLKFSVYLGDKKMRYISELHNGYIYIFYKTGILGILCYMYLLYLLYRKVYQDRNMANIFISGIGLFYFFTTLIITGIYNANDIVIFLLGAMLFFSGTLKREPLAILHK